MKKLIASIVQLMMSKASRENKINYEKYFKGAVFFRGLKSPEIKEVYREIWPKLKDMKAEEIQYLAFALISSKYAEDKHVGILLLHTILKKLNTMKLLEELKPLIDDNIYDWATADAIAGRIIRYLIPKNKKAVQEIVSWKNSKNFWRQRISAVSFVNLAKSGDYTEEIIQICTRTVRSRERFVQLGTGWLLREVSLHDQQLVIDFITEHISWFSREGLRYAIEKMPEGERKKLLKLGK